MKARKRWWSIALGVVALFAAVFAYLSRPGDDELAFLSQFKHTASVEDDGDGEILRTFRIHGDRDAIVAAIPSASLTKPYVDASAIQYSFYLPSGRYAVLTFSKTKPNRPGTLTINGAPSPWYHRALHRLGIL